MKTGRTSPALLGCTSAASGQEYDYVVKLKGGLANGTVGLVCEAVAAELADHFGINHPQQAIVDLDVGLADLIAMQEPSKADMIRGSIGLNFGTKTLTNLITWPIDRNLSFSQFEAAAKIFAFDVLVQNPDRRYLNPNLGTVGEAFYIFDHELCFSFLYDVLPAREPWMISNQGFWSDHVLFNALRHKELPLDEFMQQLSALTPDWLSALQSRLPSDWKSDVLPKIMDHLIAVAGQAETFKGEIVRRLI